MKTYGWLTVAGIALAGVSILSVGCDSAATTTSPAAQAMMLDAKPAGTMSVLQVREKLEASEPLDEVAVEGPIGGTEMPFIDGQAAFFVTTSAAGAAAGHDHDHAGHDHADHDHAGHDHGDVATTAAAKDDHAGHDHGDHDHAGHDHDAHAGHDHAGHDHENCPFCKRGVAGAKGLAVVQFVDADGQTLTQSAEKMFNLTSGKNVVVVGKPSIDELDNLYIKATKIYVK